MPSRSDSPNSRPSPSDRSSIGSRSGTTASAAAHPAWTFLSNHAHVLIVLYAEPDLVLREVAQLVGITERAVQRIVQELEESGFLTRQRIGRRNHYHIVGSMHLRHPIESHCTIDQILQLVAGNRTNHQKPRAR